MTDGVLDRIRTACASVADRASLVRVDEPRLEGYARSLPLDEIRQPSLDPAHHHLGGDDETTAAFVVTLDAVNFGSGWFPHLRMREGMSGYFTVATGLKERFDAAGPLAASALVDATPELCADVFGQDATGPVGELMALFAAAWNDLGRLLLDRYDGSFTRLVEDAGGSAERLVVLLGGLRFFADVATYRGLEVPFYKRAQITPADLSLAFGGKGLGRFSDLDRLTIFADNLVPHVLRVDGILRYDAALAAAIDDGSLVEPGSEAEIEIRASALHAVERVVAILRAGGADVTAMQLDYLLWNRGQGARYKAVPRHRTRTVFY